MFVAFPMKKRDLLFHAALVFSNLAAMMACDGEGIATCVHEYLAQTPKIRLVESKGKKAIIEAACKWARDHTACLTTVLRGCKQETIDLLESAFATFNEDPLNCNVSLNGVSLMITNGTVVSQDLLLDNSLESCISDSELNTRLQRSSCTSQNSGSQRRVHALYGNVIKKVVTGTVFNVVFASLLAFSVT